MVQHTAHVDDAEWAQAVSARYPEAYEFTLSFEGGYVDDPDDNGGCTNLGITIGTLRAWRAPRKVTCTDVAALTEAEAAEIYYANYWSPVWGSKLPVGLNAQVWDWGVNAGPSRALKALQSLSGSSVDGIMGPKTLAATEQWVAGVGIEAACRAYSQQRQKFYEGLSDWWKFKNGWTNRNTACLVLSLKLAADGPAPLSPPLVPDEGLEAAYAALLKRVEALEKWASAFGGQV